MSNNLPAIQKIDEAHSTFVSIYKAVHGCNQSDAENFYEVEKFQFSKTITETPALAQCSELSIAATFLEVIGNGLSFDSSAKHVYLVPRNVKAPDGTWQKRLTYSFAAQGLIQLCVQAGSIIGCTSPVIVYEGDVIQPETKGGILDIHHKPAIPRKSNKIIGGFCFVETTKGREGFWMDIDEVERLKGYSAKANKSQSNPDGKANELYTAGPDGQIDAGFFATKIVKAALKNYRKKKVSSDNYVDEDAIMDTPYQLPEGNTANINADKETGDLLNENETF